MQRTFVPQAQARWLLGLLLLLGTWANAQSIPNGGFDVIDANCQALITNTTTPTGDAPFFLGCVPGWQSSHGSPQIKGTSSDYYAYLWAQNQIGEGIYTSTSTLTAGKQYEINFWARSSGTASAPLNLALATNLTPGGNSNGSTPPTPNTLITLQYILTTTWQEYRYRFVAPANSAYQLWFYPPVNTSTKHNVNVNGVSFSDCVAGDVYYNRNTFSLPAETKTKGRIFAGNASVNVLSGQQVRFESRGDIQLLNGFSAEPGAEFSAQALDCAFYTGGFAVAAKGQNISSLSYTPCQCLEGTNRVQETGTLISSFSASAMAQQQVVPTDSLAEQSRPEIQIYPNPANEEITITMADPSRGTHKVVVYNSYGREVQRITLQPGQTKINVRALEPGIYYLRTTQGKQSVNTRFRIER